MLLAQASHDYPNAGTAAALAAVSGGFFLFFLVVLVVMVGIWFLIVRKTGYSPWLSLLILIPGLGHLALMLILALTEWPVERENRALRAQLGGPAPYPGTPYGGAAPAYGTQIPPPGTPPATT